MGWTTGCLCPGPSVNCCIDQDTELWFLEEKVSTAHPDAKKLHQEFRPLSPWLLSARLWIIAVICNAEIHQNSPVFFFIKCSLGCYQCSARLQSSEIVDSNRFFFVCLFARMIVVLVEGLIPELPTLPSSMTLLPALSTLKSVPVWKIIFLVTHW